MKSRLLIAVCCLGMLCVSQACMAADTMLVQVRVYRQPRPGSYEFYSGVPVQLLRNGTVVRQGTTGTKAGDRAANFRDVPKSGSYSAKALVNGRWMMNSTNEPFQGSGRRLDVIVP